MKLKSVFVAALAAAFVFVGCDKNELTDPNKGDGTEQTDPNNPSDPSNPDGTDPEDPNNPGGENPGGENPGGENPGGENPGGEEPTEKTARNLEFSSATATATLGEAEAFTAPTLSGETDGVEYSSSNTAVATVDAATGAVTLVAAGETTITAAAEETETLQAGTASYVLTVSAAAVEPVEPVLADGTYWIVANGNVATPLTSNYGYLKVTNGKNNPATNGFTFTYVSEQDAYTIQDNGGQYYYQSGNYDSYNRQATLPETGAYWKVEKADNNTYKITNLAVNKFVQYDPSYNSYGSYATQKGKLPELVSVVGNAIPYVVVDPSALSVEADKTSAQFTISANMPWTAELTTGTATLSTTSGSADATVTVSFDANIRHCQARSASAGGTKAAQAYPRRRNGDENRRVRKTGRRNLRRLR